MKLFRNKIGSLFVFCTICMVAAGLVTSCRNDLREAKTLTIKIVPYEGFTQAEASILADELQENMAPLLDDCMLVVDVMPCERLPKTFKSVGRNRFRADSIIRSLEREKERGVIRMGVTHHDISTSVHGIEDFGVLGLSFCPGHSCVVSTYRVKDAQHQFWKVAAHEAMHAMGLKHCPNDDPKCLMKDAKKHPRLELQEGLCPTCDSLLNQSRLH